MDIRDRIEQTDSKYNKGHMDKHKWLLYSFQNFRELVFNFSYFSYFLYDILKFSLKRFQLRGKIINFYDIIEKK